jgi:hypothetical protein
MFMIVLVLLVALGVAVAGTLLFGPLLLLGGVVILVAGLSGARWFGRQAEAAADVASHPHEVLTAPEPEELTEAAERRAAAAPDDVAGTPGDAERARRRAGTT